MIERSIGKVDGGEADSKSNGKKPQQERKNVLLERGNFFARHDKSLKNNAHSKFFAKSRYQHTSNESELRAVRVVMMASRGSSNHTIAHRI